MIIFLLNLAPTLNVPSALDRDVALILPHTLTPSPRPRRKRTRRKATLAAAVAATQARAVEAMEAAGAAAVAEVADNLLLQLLLLS